MTMFPASYSDSECCLCFRASSFQISGTVSVGRAEDRGAACNDTQLFIFPGCVLLSINTWCLRHGDGIATAQRFRAQELAEPTEPHPPVSLDHETKTDRDMILSRPDRGYGGETLTRQTQRSPGLHVRAHTRGKRCRRVAGSWRGLAWTWERESAFISFPSPPNTQRYTARRQNDLVLTRPALSRGGPQAPGGFSPFARPQKLMP